MRRYKPRTLRMLTTVAIILLAMVGYIAGLDLGTPSSIGIGSFFLICPLGGLEVLLASKTFIPSAVISLVVVVILALLLGRSWCAWGCPAKVVKGICGRKEAHAEAAVVVRSIKETFLRDSRLWVLVAFLIAAVVIGFPIFCLVCPIGLTFGTVFSLIRLFTDADVNIGLLAFPLALVIELVAMKKWCLRICPVAGLLSLLGRFGKVGCPTVKRETCLLEQGAECHSCLQVCPEHIDLHAQDVHYQLADCTRCGECVHVCPSQSVSLSLWSSVGRSDVVDKGEVALQAEGGSAQETMSDMAKETGKETDKETGAV